MRVAAYKLLATLPGVRAAGTVADPLGRRGVAVEMAGEQGTRDRLVIVPASGRLLARETINTGKRDYPAGATLQWVALVESGWTDNPPAHAVEIPTPPAHEVKPPQ